MEDKIELEEYVRTKDGLIGKYEGRKPEYFECIITDTFVGLEEEIVKHSKNIIDLIEVGDYVNGEKVLRIDDIESKDKKLFVIFKFRETEHCKIWSNSDIKSIVTKEQLESTKYEVEHYEKE